MIKTLTNWNIFKWIRFVIAAFFLGYGIYHTDWLLIIAGIFLIYMIIFNKGCMRGSCEISPKKTGDKN
jgi:hypothetical protein